MKWYLFAIVGFLFAACSTTPYEPEQYDISRVETQSDMLDVVKIRVDSLCRAAGSSSNISSLRFVDGRLEARFFTAPSGMVVGGPECGINNIPGMLRLVECEMKTGERYFDGISADSMQTAPWPAVCGDPPKFSRFAGVYGTPYPDFWE